MIEMLKVQKMGIKKDVETLQDVLIKEMKNLGSEQYRKTINLIEN